MNSYWALAAALLTFVISVDATNYDEMQNANELELVDHGYEEMTIFAISEKSASGLLNRNISIESLKKNPEFVIHSNELAYIGRLVRRFEDSEPEVECKIDGDLEWIVQFRSADSVVLFVSNGKVISGPNDFCRSAATIGSFDPLRGF